MSRPRGRGGSLQIGRNMDEDYLMDFYQYPNTIFHISTHKSDDRGDFRVTNCVTCKFFKESLSEPLVIKAPKEPDIFTILYKDRKRCCIHQVYMEFLSRKEVERKEVDKKRKVEILRR